MPGRVNDRSERVDISDDEFGHSFSAVILITMTLVTICSSPRLIPIYHKEHGCEEPLLRRKSDPRKPVKLADTHFSLARHNRHNDQRGSLASATVLFRSFVPPRLLYAFDRVNATPLVLKQKEPPQRIRRSVATTVSPDHPMTARPRFSVKGELPLFPDHGGIR